MRAILKGMPPLGWGMGLRLLPWLLLFFLFAPVGGARPVGDGYEELIQQVQEIKNELQSLSYRVGQLESRVGETQIGSINNRLTKVELVLQSSQNVLNAILIAIVANIISTFWRFVVDRKPGAKEGE